MICALACIIGGGAAVTAGANGGTVETAAFLLQTFCLIFIPVAIGGLVIDLKQNKDFDKRQLERKNQLSRIAVKYNNVIELLKTNYSLEKKSLGLFDEDERDELRKSFEHKYEENRRAYENERLQFLNSTKASTSSSRKFKEYWKAFIVISFLTQLMACGYTFGSISTETEQPLPKPVVSKKDSEPVAWNAENIPMPHLTDGSRYVSNPDNVVSENTERLLNTWLKRFDDSLQIESAMIIVNHVENEDPFRIAQDIFDRYKVGKNDRGMVIVLAYEDHQIRTHTGRSLEADLTDIECFRLQQDYAIPCMKAEQPDSGILYLTEAIYNTLQKKELPKTYIQQQEERDDELAGILAAFMFVFGMWLILIGYLYSRYNENIGRQFLRPNPFIKTSVIVAVGRLSGGRPGGFGGGGSFGGGFSGGSSGGGGATSSW